MTRLALLLPALLFAGCQFYTPWGPINGAGRGGRPAVTAPAVEARSVRLAQAPAPEAIARWYCEQELSPLICQAFGPMPSAEQLQFLVDVDLAVTNPNTIPVPVVSSLVALTVFPTEEDEAAAEAAFVSGGSTADAGTEPSESASSGTSTSGDTSGTLFGLPTGRPARDLGGADTGPADNETLGSVCITLCEDEGTSCPQDPDTCRLEGSIRDVDDFVGAAVGFLTSVAVGERRLEDLRVRTIASGQTTAMSFRLAIEPDQMLRVLVRVFTDLFQDLQAGRTPQIAIPFKLEGTVFIDVENFGRFAAEFPPFEDRWTL